MTLRILQTRAANDAARAEMQRAGISYWPKRPPRRLADYLLLRRAMPVGEPNKSWDVLQTVRLLQERLPLDAPILDLGAYASEVLCSLHLAGFRQLIGIDLNPSIRFMPFHDAIQSVTGDMMATPFPDQSMAAITSISAIEHGVSLRPLFAEVSRLLQPGGLFLASTDYWPEKIDTTGIRMYDLPWKVFSRDEVRELLAIAAEYGLTPLGDLSFDSNEAPIEAAGKHFTFAWLALTKL